MVVEVWVRGGEVGGVGGGREGGRDGEGGRKEQRGVRGQDVNKETVTIGAGGEQVQLGQ